MKLYKITLRACSVSFCVRIFEQYFAEDKEKICRQATALQEFLTQDSAKYAEKDVRKKILNRLSEAAGANR